MGKKVKALSLKAAFAGLNQIDCVPIYLRKFFV